MYRQWKYLKCNHNVNWKNRISVTENVHKGNFPKNNFPIPSDNFTSDNFQNVQFPKRQLLLNVLSMKSPIYEINEKSYLWNVISMKCPIYEMSFYKMSFYEMSQRLKLPYGKLHIWEVTTWENTHTWEVVAWEKAIGEVPNILDLR